MLFKESRTYCRNVLFIPLTFSYIVLQIAITGKSFSKSSAIATELIMNNILRIGKVNVVGDVILSLGKLCVSLSSALFGFLMLDTHRYKSAHNKISSPLFPVLVCLFILRHSLHLIWLNVVVCYILRILEIINGWTILGISFVTCFLYFLHPSPVF